MLFVEDNQKESSIQLSYNVIIYFTIISKSLYKKDYSKYYLLLQRIVKVNESSYLKLHDILLNQISNDYDIVYYITILILINNNDYDSIGIFWTKLIKIFLDNHCKHPIKLINDLYFIRNNHIYLYICTIEYCNYIFDLYI